VVGLAVQQPTGLPEAKVLSVINGHIYKNLMELTEYYIFSTVAHVQ
jgi:hypothetical protein